ncbi:YrhC family protein [Thalassobacillus sp. C254]|uniref:YrhC family protein n=1 Tax=Thalassobacillus sp. C254 TaxID=1225341 RepID=UPI0006D0E892|nr:YrhC family protein [Thalassobacillus sp. C254]
MDNGQQKDRQKISRKLSRADRAKAGDYKRFSFILLSLAAFITIGFFLPDTNTGFTEYPQITILTVFTLCGAAMVLHRISMKCWEEKDSNL